jgi:hypothetical protein
VQPHLRQQALLMLLLVVGLARRSLFDWGFQRLVRQLLRLLRLPWEGLTAAAGTGAAAASGRTARALWRNAASLCGPGPGRNEEGPAGTPHQLLRPVLPLLALLLLLLLLLLQMLLGPKSGSSSSSSNRGTVRRSRVNSSALQSHLEQLVCSLRQVPHSCCSCCCSGAAVAGERLSTPRCLRSEGQSKGTTVS